MQSSEHLGNTFGRAWQLLTQNWILIVPGIAVAIVAAIVIALLAMFGAVSSAGFGAAGMAGASVASALFSAMIAGVVLMLASIIVVAFTTGMAGAAWQTGTATFADGTAAFRQRGADVLIAIVLLFILGIIAVALSMVTFGLALAAFYLFFLYTMPSVIVGGRPAVDALGESARITSKNFLMTLGVIVLLIVGFIIASLIGRIFGGIPFLGAAVVEVIVQIFAAYATLVIVGEYLKLRPAAYPPAAS
jgi:hypothetical protein